MLSSSLRWPPPGPRLAQGAGETHDVDPPCARSAQRRGARVDRRARGVDVVDQPDGGRRGLGCERPSYVAAALRESQSALGTDRPRTPYQILQWELPAPGELRGEPLRGNVTARTSALAIAGDERERDRRRPRHDRGDELRAHRHEVAPGALLPLSHQAAPAPVVGDRSPCAREGQPPAGALRTAPNGPGPRRAAPLAEGRREPYERTLALRAQRCSDRPADGTPAR